MPTSFAQRSSFRLHTFREPDSLNPLLQKNSNAGYITQQLFLSPLRWKSGKIEAGFLKDCRSENLKDWSCTWVPTKYSDGTDVRPEDFLRHLKMALDPATLSPLASDLFVINGARQIFEKKPNAPELGIQIKKNKIAFQLTRPDFEFPLRLINPHWSPFKKTGQDLIVGTGAYALEKWDRGSLLRLKPNPYFLKGHRDRPFVEFIFQAEDSIALKLYENNELSFLRRLPTLYLAKYKDSLELHKLNQIRFDYFGYGKIFWEKPQTLLARKFIAENLPYEEMGTLLSSVPRPGCFGLPLEWSAEKVCYPLGKENPSKDILPMMNISFSQNVDDNKRVLEWLQNRLAGPWKWQLGLDGLENKTFLDRLNQRKLTFFRKGLAPDRPSCLAILENFEAGATENFIDFNDPEYQLVLEKLRIERRIKTRVRLCREGLEILKKAYVMIPTGPIYFAILAKPQWTGWSLNEINVLDLSQLHLKTKGSTKE